MAVPTMRVNVRGVNVVLRRLRSLDPNISEAQKLTGQKLGNKIRAEARRIIKSSAPKSSGTLYKSIAHPFQAKINKGWNTTIKVDDNAAYYAGVVESGGPPEPKKVTGNLLKWVERVLGDAAANKLKGRTMSVRTQKNPRYDTAIGMRFFQIPFARHRETIDDEYDAAVKAAVKKSGLK